MFLKIAELRLRPDRQGFIQLSKNSTHSLGASGVHIRPDRQTQTDGRTNGR